MSIIVWIVILVTRLLKIYNTIKYNKNIIPNFEIVDENIIKLNNLSINK